MLTKGNNNTGAGFFLSIKHGGICKESKVPLEGYEEIEVVIPSTGEKVIKYVNIFNSLKGKIIGAEFYKKEIPNTSKKVTGLYLYIYDDEVKEKYVLNLPYPSKPLTSFLKMAESIDYNLPIEVISWRGKDGSTAFTIKQGDEIIRQKYTRDNLGDCPPAEYNPIIEKYDFSKQITWLINNFNEKVLPLIEEAVANSGIRNSAKFEVEEEYEEEAVSSNKAEEVEDEFIKIVTGEEVKPEIRRPKAKSAKTKSNS